MRDILQDIRYAWRQLRHAPGFAITAVLTLALGIGAATAIVGILNALTDSMRPSVSTDGVYNVVKRGVRTKDDLDRVRISEYQELAAHPMPGAAAITASGVWMRVTIQIPGRAESVTAMLIPGSFGRFFNVSAQAGRWIAPDDDRPGANQVAVISDRLWRSLFGGQPEIAGRTSVRLNLTPFAIVGVAPVGFRGLDDAGTDVWLPLSTFATIDPSRVDVYERLFAMIAFVRPKPGVTADQLAAEASAILPNAALPARSKTELPEPATIELARPRVGDLSDRRESWLALSLATLILIAACANLANLVFARGLHRTGEVAVRASLGASTARLMRLFVAETAIIAVSASSLGLAIAVGAMRLFASAIPAFQTNRYERVTVDLSPDLGVFFFAFGAGALAALIVGTTTAWRMSRVPPLRVLAGSGASAGLTSRGGRTRMVLVAIQVTAAVVLVMGAAVAVERFQQDRARTGGPVTARYDEAMLASARVDLELLKFTEPQGRAFFEELLTRARALPGVEAAAITSSLHGGSYSNLETEPPAGGRVGSPTLARVYPARISPGYLRTLGVRLTRGRDFTAFDTDGALKVALVSESAVEHLWPRGEDPIGKRVKFGPWDWVTIVGVTADLVSSIDNGPLRPSNAMFIPFAQWYQAGAVIVVRTPAPAGTLEPLRLAINEVNPDVAVFDATSGDDYVRVHHGVELAFGALMASLGLVALGIAVLGVYGVVAYFVSVRRREFGIRLALGATPGRVVKLVVDHAIHIVLVGLLPGVFLVSILSRIGQAWFKAYEPTNIPTWFVVPALILVAGAFAGYLPARRAARVDPNVALRNL